MPTYADYINALKREVIYPRFKVELLAQDESVLQEITNDIISDSGSLTINYQQGIRRSCSLTLYNVDGLYTPNANGILWVSGKFKLYLGINIDGEDYWIPNGVFVLSNPEANDYYSNKTLILNGIDKFALLDGTLGGTLDGTYEIALGENIYSAIKSILAFDNGNGYSIDSILPILDSLYKDEITPYTLTKSVGGTYGDILIELANAISCDIYYDENGRLNLQNGVLDLTKTYKPSLWTYSPNELEYLGSMISYQFDKVYNVVKIIGDNVDGEIFDATAENTNPFSPIRIARIGKHTMPPITDEVIQSNDLAQQRADYELLKVSIMQAIVKLDSTFMCHLNVDNCIDFTNEYFGYENERFFIQSLNIPLSANSKITIDATNIKTLPFYSSTASTS